MRWAAALYGLLRSLVIYWADPWQRPRLRAFYAGFIRDGDLCFDIGAHAGNRSFAFARLGGRVVAVEPQPLFERLLRRIFAGNSNVMVLGAAVGAVPGSILLAVSRATPTVTSASAGFLAAVATVPSFAWVRWDERLPVPVVTLDQLIARHGLPRFVKIDVEGMEPEVLMGLGQAVPALSFEFIPANPLASRRCIERLGALGDYRYNVCMGERLRFVFADWQEGAAVQAWLEALPRGARSGDVYAVLEAAFAR